MKDLPEEFSLAKILAHILTIHSIEVGLTQIKLGQTVPFEQVKKEMFELIEKKKVEGFGNKKEKIEVEKVIDTIASMPEGTSIDDIVERIFLLRKSEERLKNKI